MRVLSYETTGYLAAALAIVSLVAGAAFAAERPAGGPAGDSTDTTKYEFGSEAWVSLARDYLVAAVGDADLEGIRFSFCEVYTDPPAYLLEPGESTTGWYVSIADGEFRWGSSPGQRAA